MAVSAPARAEDQADAALHRSASPADAGVSGRVPRRGEHARDTPPRFSRPRGDADAAADAPELFVANQVCAACMQPIDAQDAEDGVVHMSEQFWHLPCFACLSCGRSVPLNQEDVLLVGSQPMCGSACGELIESDVSTRAADTILCTACRVPLSPPGRAVAPAEQGDSGAAPMLAPGNDAPAVTLPHDAPALPLEDRKPTRPESSMSSVALPGAYVDDGDGAAPRHRDGGADMRTVHALVDRQGDHWTAAQRDSTTRPAARDEIGTRAPMPSWLGHAPAATTARRRSLQLSQGSAPRIAAQALPPALTPAAAAGGERRQSGTGDAAPVQDVSVDAAPADAAQADTAADDAVWDEDARNASQSATRPTPSALRTPVRTGISERVPPSDRDPASPQPPLSHVAASPQPHPPTPFLPAASPQLLPLSRATSASAHVSTSSPATSAASPPLPSSADPGAEPLPNPAPPPPPPVQLRARRETGGGRSSPSRTMSGSPRSFEHAYDRLSEVIHMEIVQSYYATGSRANTPLHSDERNMSTLPEWAARPRGSDARSISSLDLRMQRARRSVSTTSPCPPSVSESEIHRTLSLYDTEFEGLLATPTSLRDSRRWSSVSDTSGGGGPGGERRASGADRRVSLRARPRVETPDADAAASPAQELEQMDMRRRVAIAELLAIDSVANAPPPSVHAKVEQVLNSFAVHMDTIKEEYVTELHSLAQLQLEMRDELRAMTKLRGTLAQETHRLSEQAKSLRAGAASARSSGPTAPPWLQSDAPNSAGAPASAPASAPPSATMSRAQSTWSGPPAAHAAPSRTPSAPGGVPAAPPDAEPVASPAHRFRWMRLRLLANPDANALLPAERERGVSLISPPVPPKDTDHRPAAAGMVRSASGPVPTSADPRCVASPPGTSMLGRSLEEQVRLEGRGLVPRIVDWCIAAVEANGLQDEGLYRKPGGSQRQRQLIRLFDRGEPFDLCNLHDYPDVGAVAGALKQYLRELPEPLIPRSHHAHFVKLGDRIDSMDTAAALPAMCALVRPLPAAHRATLQRVCLHLQFVHQHGEKTRMSARNLGLVFGPTLMRAADPVRELVEAGSYAKTFSLSMRRRFSGRE
ncbi:Rho GTPase-activating protein [Malassezia sp. CBS 17886]|nr:Rho GTPase-activating protein [Malassezia sp. CBS 17886]